jgi:hypothetical protein
MGGCAAPPRLPDGAAELAEVPFFPQTEFDCGPAALATLLMAAAVPVTPAELIDEVYVAGLNGSLQAELLAGTRRHGLLPVPVTGGLPSLLAEIRGQRPVLVMQNLGWRRAPRWHYAVVVGFDSATDRFILRSGAERRRIETAGRFMRSWERAEQWGFVAVRPGDIPVSTTANAYMRAVVDAQRVLGRTRADAAYAAALDRWPDDPLVLFLAGVAAHAADRLEEAAGLYRRAIAADPGHAAARNNLAAVLLARGCRAEALVQVRSALDRDADRAFRTELIGTLAEIERSPDARGEPASCSAG